MKIQYLNGGLANQVFQYIFVRFAEIYNPGSEPWLIDDSFFFVNNVHNGYELERVFGIKANLLSQNFDEDVWAEFIKNKQNGISVPQTFQNMGIPMKMIAEFPYYNDPQHVPFNGEVQLVKPNEFQPEITRFTGALYYFGYWINREWLNAYKDIITSELTFPPITDSVNRAYVNQILSCKSTGIHIRLGDFVKLGVAADPSFYRTSIQTVLNEHPDTTLFVFSDDIKWCQENREILGLNLPKEIVYVTGNEHLSSHIDLQLLSLCQGLILNNSSFGYLASLLNSRLDYYINPCVFRSI